MPGVAVSRAPHVPAARGARREGSATTSDPAPYFSPKEEKVVEPAVIEIGSKYESRQKAFSSLKCLILSACAARDKGHLQGGSISVQ